MSDYLKDEETEKAEMWLFLNASPMGVDSEKDGSPTAEEIAELPENVHAMLSDNKTAAFIYLTGKNNNLDDSQITDLARIIKEIGFGKADPAKITDMISERLGLDKEVAQKISATLTKTLISPNYFQIVHMLNRKKTQNSNKTKT